MRLEFISAVEPDWVDRVFLPELQVKASEQRQPIIWIITDSAIEANYLLEKIRAWAITQNRAFSTIVLHPSDPLLIWEDLFGSANEEGALFKATGIIGVWNGCFVPLDFLAQRMDQLRRACTVSNVSLLLPLYHESFRALRDHLPIAERVEVPPFGSFSDATRIDLLGEVVATAIPSLDEAERLWLAKELVLARPNSRVEAEHWIGYYAEQSDIRQALRAEPPPPPVERFPTLPPNCPTRDQLKATFDSAQLKLEEASNLFQAWVGRPLTKRVIKVVEPFQSDSALWWFGASVSALSCQLFDGMDPAFEFMLGFTVENQVITSAPPDLFFKILRSLRTVMQHGMILGEVRNHEKLNHVRSWFQAQCGNQYPQRADWRRLTARLLTEWDRAAARLRDVLEHIGQDDMRAAVAVQLQNFERRLSKNEWRTLLADAVSNINPTVDTELLLDKHLASLQRDLQKVAVKREYLWQAAQELAEGIVVKVSSRSPLDLDDLIDLGIPRGPRLGQAKEHADAIWHRSPQTTKEELLEEIGQWWKSTTTAPNGS